MTQAEYSTDAHAREVEAVVIGADRETGGVLLDRTVLYREAAASPPIEGGSAGG